MKRARKQAHRALFYKQPVAYPARLWRHWTYSCTKQILPIYASIPPAQPTITTSGAKFRANGIYDPDIQTGGQVSIGQADTFMGWDHYIVYYSRMTAMFWPWTTVTNPESPGYGSLTYTGQAATPVWFGLSVRDNTNSMDLTTINLMNTDRLTSYHTTSMVSEIAKGGRFTLTQWFNARAFFNCDPRDRDELIAPTNGDPTEGCYYLLSSAPTVAPFSGLNNDFGAWNVTVHIDFWGFCMEPKQRGAIP